MYSPMWILPAMERTYTTPSPESQEVSAWPVRSFFSLFSGLTPCMKLKGESEMQKWIIEKSENLHLPRNLRYSVWLGELEQLPSNPLLSLYLVFLSSWASVRRHGSCEQLQKPKTCHGASLIPGLPPLKLDYRVFAQVSALPRAGHGSQARIAEVPGGSFPLPPCSPFSTPPASRP